MKRKISIVLIIITIFNYIYFVSATYASQIIGATTGNSRKEAAETLAAWCIDFYNKHDNQVVYIYGRSWNEPREISYKLPVSDSDTTTQYEFDCVGWVSFAVHHALGLGEEEFTYFATPDGYGGDISNGFEKVYVPLGELQPGDLFVEPNHVGIYVGNGMCTDMALSENGGLLYRNFNDYNYCGYVGRITEEAARNANFNYMPGSSTFAPGLEMKGTMISDCIPGGDGYSGGTAGDQSGYEYAVKEYVDYGFSYALRYPDEKVGATIATIAINAANNDNIGYDQGERMTYWQQLVENNYDSSKITVPCESDCSASSCAAVVGAGFILDNADLKSISPDGCTSDMVADYLAHGFKQLGPECLSGPENLLAGDVLVAPGFHATVFVGNGEGGGGIGKISYPIDELTINLDDQEFEFSGLPQTAIYAGDKKAGEWIFEKISQFIDFIVSIITNGIKMSLLGWAMAIESIIDASIKFLEGSQ